MAGYKETIFTDSPVSFWTFDFDRAGMNGSQIIDEIDNLNPLITGNSGYWLEQQSLNDLEVTDQYSVSFGKNGRNDYDYSKYQSYFECIHSTVYDFYNNGSFSIEFLYYKETPGVIRDYGEPGHYRDIVSPIFKKGSMIECKLVYPWYNQPYFTVRMFGGTREVRCQNDWYPVFYRTNHVVIVFDVRRTDVNKYQSDLKLYINGKLWGTNTQTHTDTYPSTSVSDSWFFGGVPDVTDPVTGWNRELLKLDQFAIYNYSLSDAKISNHYRKTKRYADLIRFDQPDKYWRMDEIQDITDLTLYADVGGVNGSYVGSVYRHNPGPEKIIDAHSPEFRLDSSAHITSYNNYGNPSPIITINHDYTVEFWFKSTDGDRGVLLSCVEENSPWDGLVIFLNSKNHQHSPGNVQIQENMNNFLNSRDTNPATGERENWNDGNWHHLLIRRYGNHLELWLDGEKNSEGVFDTVSNGDPSQLHLMGMAPGKFGITGYMCELAYYTHSLQDIQIMSRWLFTTRFKIFGYTLLQGNPIKATVRFYDHITGELIEELESDSTTGEYVFYPYSNRFVDILSFVQDNKTTRYRVHGPVKPAEYDDSHLTT